MEHIADLDVFGFLPRDVTEEAGRGDQLKNRVYATPLGRFFKVQTFEFPDTPPHLRAFRFSGSRCDATGKAMLYRDAPWIMLPHMHTASALAAYAPGLQDQVEEARLKYVQRMEAQVTLDEQPAPKGVAPMPPELLEALRREAAKGVR